MSRGELLGCDGCGGELHAELDRGQTLCPQCRLDPVAKAYTFRIADGVALAMREMIIANNPGGVAEQVRRLGQLQGDERRVAVRRVTKAHAATIDSFEAKFRLGILAALKALVALTTLLVLLAGCGPASSSELQVQDGGTDSGGRDAGPDVVETVTGECVVVDAGDGGWAYACDAGVTP